MKLTVNTKRLIAGIVTWVVLILQAGWLRQFLDASTAGGLFGYWLMVFSVSDFAAVLAALFYGFEDGK